MKSMWDEATRSEIAARVRNVKDDSKSRWGRMSAGGMLRHIEQSLRMTIGELPVRPRKLPLRYFPLKQLVIYALPMPKGAPTAPELIVTTAAPCGATVPEIERLLEKFGQTVDTSSWPAHPAFGRLSRRAVGHLVWKHLDHHLRQFGC